MNTKRMYWVPERGHNAIGYLLRWAEMCAISLAMAIIIFAAKIDVTAKMIGVSLDSLAELHKLEFYLSFGLVFVIIGLVNTLSALWNRHIWKKSATYKHEQYTKAYEKVIKAEENWLPDEEG